jgi:hypothetical protein
VLPCTGAVAPIRCILDCPGEATVCYFYCTQNIEKIEAKMQNVHHDHSSASTFHGKSNECNWTGCAGARDKSSASEHAIGCVVLEVVNCVNQ